MTLVWQYIEHWSMTLKKKKHQWANWTILCISYGEKKVHLTHIKYRDNDIQDNPQQLLSEGLWSANSWTKKSDFRFRFERIRKYKIVKIKLLGINLFQGVSNLDMMEAGQARAPLVFYQPLNTTVYKRIYSKLIAAFSQHLDETCRCLISQLTMVTVTSTRTRDWPHIFDTY